MNIKMKKKTIILFLLFFMADHCLWLVNSDVQGRVNEFCWILIFALFIIDFGIFHINDMLNRKKYHFCYEVLFTIIMGIYSTIQSHLLHDQTIAQGLAPQRFMIIGFFMYFVLMKYINNKTYALDSIKKIVLFLGYLELFLYILQYLLIDYSQFLQINYNTRLGEIRMNLGAIAVPFVIFNSVNNIYKKRQTSWKDVLLIAAGFYYSFIVAKTRIVLIAYIIALIGGYLVWKRGGKRKFGIFLALVALIVFLSQTELFSYLIDGLNGLDNSTQTREVGRAYYLTKIAEHPILGCGYINTNNVNAVAYAGIYSTSEGIYWVDLGVYGLTFFFGIIGLLWFVLLYGKMTSKAFKVAKKGNLTFWMYMLYMIVISPNGTGFLWNISSTIEFVIWLSLIEGEYKKCCLMSSDLNE